MKSVKGIMFAKIICFQFKGWNHLHHQPVLKFLLFLPAGQQEKSAEISKLVDDEAGSILSTKNKISSIKPIPAMSMPDLCKNSNCVVLCHQLNSFNADIATTKQDKCKHMIRRPVRSNNCMMTSFFPLSLLKANHFQSCFQRLLQH